MRHLRRFVMSAALVSVPAACDAFTPPTGFDSGPFDGEGGTFGGVFCPETALEIVTPRLALQKPLFAWVTAEERDAIEAGGGVLPTIPVLSSSVNDRLVAAMHDSLPGWSSPEHPLVGQPRVGRSFWPFAFSVPPASAEHDQLLMIQLRSDAWFASYKTGFPVVNVASSTVFNVDFESSPGRIAGVDTATYPSCYRENFPERAFILFREEAIERIRFGDEVLAHLDTELDLLQRIFNQVRAESHLNPVAAFDYVTCGDSSSFVLCPENTYVQAISWPTPTYLPTVAALPSQIDRLRKLAQGPNVSIDRTSTDELAAWEAVWPGPWREPDMGLGGAGGSGGLGGSGG